MRRLSKSLREQFQLLASEGKLSGAFADIHGDDYHETLPGISKTDIEYASWSPANMVARKEMDGVESEALLLGKMLHARLEHHPIAGKYRKLFAVKPKFTGEGARTHEREWLEKNRRRTIITESQDDTLEGMYRGVLANPQSRVLLDAEGVAEETIFWTDPDSGELCKCRPDRRVLSYMGQTFVLDYKTIGQFDEKHIRESIEAHHYNVSAAFTIDGCKAVGIDPGIYLFVFIEKSGAHKVLCVPAQDIDIELGRRRYKILLKQIAACRQTGVYPGFKDIGMSDWFREKEMQKLNEMEMTG